METQTLRQVGLEPEADFPGKTRAALATQEHTVQTTVGYSDALVRSTVSVSLSQEQPKLSTCRSFSKGQNSRYPG